MSTIFSSSESRDLSAASRFDIWAAAWEMVKDHPLGVGIGHFESQIGQYGQKIVSNRDAHNTFVLCAGELGIPGLFAYLATIVTAWLTLSRVNHRLKTSLIDTELLALLVFAARLALVVYLVSGLFVSRLYTEGAWWFIVLPACLARAVENEYRSAARTMIVVNGAENLDRLPAGTVMALQ
jgi:O-antigen ligase